MRKAELIQGNLIFIFYLFLPSRLFLMRAYLTIFVFFPFYQVHAAAIINFDLEEQNMAIFVVKSRHRVTRSFNFRKARAGDYMSADCPNYIECNRILLSNIK